MEGNNTLYPFHPLHAPHVVFSPNGIPDDVQPGDMILINNNRHEILQRLSDSMVTTGHGHTWIGDLEATARMLDGEISLPHKYKQRSGRRRRKYAYPCTVCEEAALMRKRYRRTKRLQGRFNYASK